MSSSFPFGRYPFLSGVASTLDIAGTRYRRKFSGPSVPPEVADARALESDWKAVGEDIGNAMKVIRVKRSLAKRVKP